MQSVILVLLFLPCCSCSRQVTGDNPEEAIVTVAGGNILDETWNRLSKLYTVYPSCIHPCTKEDEEEATFEI
jgi:hypothetical protein